MWVMQRLCSQFLSSLVKRPCAAAPLRIPSRPAPVSVDAACPTLRSGPVVTGLWTNQAITSPLEAVGGNQTFRTLSAQLQDDMSSQVQQQQEEVQEGKVKDAEIMSESYGHGYATRSSDEGFGQIYCETVKVTKELDDGSLEGPSRAVHVVHLAKVGDDVKTIEEHDEEPGTIPHDFDTGQGHPVFQKEHGRHSMREDACEDGESGKKRAQEDHRGAVM